MSNLAYQIEPDEAQVLTKALLRAASAYGLKGRLLSEILGVSEASATRLHQGARFIEPQSKEGELAILLIRLYRSLNVLVGNDCEKAKAWLHASNDYFHHKPIDQIRQIQGLVEVVNYLDAMRGKL